jgi:hypothetical protein
VRAKLQASAEERAFRHRQADGNGEPSCRLTIKRKCHAAVILVVTLWAVFGSTRNSLAADDVTVADLQAATRAIGFLDNLPRDGTTVIGVVYASQNASGKALALQTVNLLSTLQGPNKSTIRARVVSASTRFS